MLRQRIFLATIALVAALVSIDAAPVRAAEPEPIDPARVQAVAAMLPKTPRGVGPTIADRAAWDAAARWHEFSDVVPRAEALLKQPIPELTDDLYLDFSRTGNRSRCQRVLSRRHGRVSTLVLAECLENRGRFLPAIAEAIRAVCDEKDLGHARSRRKAEQLPRQGRRDRPRRGRRLLESGHCRLLAGREAQQRRAGTRPPRIGPPLLHALRRHGHQRRAADVVADDDEQLERCLLGRRDRHGPDPNRIARAASVLCGGNGKVYPQFSQRVYAGRLLF